MSNLVSKCISTVMRVPIHGLYQLVCRARCKNYDPCIISQNCVGGVMYSILGIEFQSPTINLFIEGEDFVRFAENLEHYISLEAEPCGTGVLGDVNYPIIKVGDVCIQALHYETTAEAVEAWNRRRLRANLDNVFVVANAWNLKFNPELIKRIDNLPYPSIIFSDVDFDGVGNIKRLRGQKWHRDERMIVRPDLTSWSLVGLRQFEMQFDFVDWINRR